MNQNKMVLPRTFVNDVRRIIEQGRRQAYAAAGQVAVMTYWNVGRRIVEEEQHGGKRAAYGSRLIKNLSEELVPVYGNNYGKRNLDYFRRFYLSFPDAEMELCQNGVNGS